MRQGPSEVSPFLHREERHAYHPVVNAQQERAARDRFYAQITLEKLRYRQWVRWGTLDSFMQRLGDWGRRVAGFFDPRQTGGGWW